MDDITFCTLTTYGYMEFTINCINSLKKIGIHDKLQVYCTDKISYDKIKPQYENTFYIEQDIFDTGKPNNKNGMIVFEDKSRFGRTMILKLLVIYTCLKKSKYVLFTDGDIFYHKPGFFEYLLNKIGDKNMLVQNDKMDGHVSCGDHLPVCCAGFMFIKKNNDTLEMFNYETKNTLYRSLFDTSERGGWFDDQLYLRKLKNVHNDIAKIEILPSELFPTWYVHMNRGSDINNFKKTWGNKYLLHYNYIKGWEKKRKMKDQDSWISGDTIK